MIKTKYFYTVEDGREVELPFNPENEIQEVHKEGKILLGVLARDEFAGDPFEEFDEGILCRFQNTPRPNPENFKEVIRDNRGRVFYVYSRSDGYFCGSQALIKNADEIENADGYYIVPEDVPARSRASYAKGMIEQYSAWCTGDVWGVCVWTYDETTLELEDRDECWGYYSYEYAENTLKEALNEN
jgi:hypothetical protein